MLPDTSPDTVIKIRTFHRRLPVADKHCSYSKVCMFFQPLVKCSAGQLLLHRGGTRTYTNDLSQYTQEYSLYRKASVMLLSSNSGVVYSIICSLIFKESFILVHNCVVRNNISYFLFISDFSDFVSTSE
jgi:hypothetical protein